jgi:hypothetical protein
LIPPLILCFYIITKEYLPELHDKAKETVRFTSATNSYAAVSQSMAETFDKKVDHRLLIRRLGVNADKTTSDDGIYQLDLFTDYEALPYFRSGHMCHYLRPLVKTVQYFS